MLSDPVAEAFGLIHRHPSGENFWHGSKPGMMIALLCNGVTLFAKLSQNVTGLILSVVKKRRKANADRHLDLFGKLQTDLVTFKLTPCQCTFL